MFKFYALVETEEHMLYTREIAEMLDIYSTTGNPHSSLIKTMILDYLEENDIKYQPHYFNSRNGLKEVFSANHYVLAFKRLNYLATNSTYISLNDKKYNFVKAKENVLCHI